MRKITLIVLLSLFCRLTVSGQYLWGKLGLGTNLSVQVLAVDSVNNVLYAGGLFTQAGGIPVLGIAKWDGSTWSPLGTGIVVGSVIKSLLVDNNGDLVAGGAFTNIGGTAANNIARWDGTSWSALDAGLGYTGATTVSTMLIYNGDLHAGGLFSNSGTTVLNNISRWDGTSWQPLSNGTNGEVRSLCEYKGELYVGGTFSLADSIPVKNIARWDGINWMDVDGGVDYTGATTVSTMRVYNDEIYVGGTFSIAGTLPVRNIAKWDGASWGDVGGGTDYTGATTVSTMKIFNNELIVGGLFDSLGTVEATNIGKWDGSEWHNMGSGTGSRVFATESLYDTLYIGGEFTTVGNDSIAFVASWKPDAVMAVKASGHETIGVYPNPVQDRVFITVKNGPKAKAANNFSLQLINQFGQQVAKFDNISDEIVFDRKNIPSGLYFYKITGIDNSLIQQGKLIFR